jgi:hypothetical protein
LAVLDLFWRLPEGMRTTPLFNFLDDFPLDFFTVDAFLDECTLYCVLLLLDDDGRECFGLANPEYILLPM